MKATKIMFLHAASAVLLAMILANCSKDMILQSGNGNANDDNFKKGTLSPSAIQTVDFCGKLWNVKSGDGLGPGSNNWNPGNAWVDSYGKLHMKISYNTLKNKWDCAEIWTQELLGFGTYEWTVVGRIEKLHKNIVLGLFNYLPTTVQGAKKTAEIDIEFSKWGNDGNNKPGGFTVWPNKTNLNYWTYPFSTATTDILMETRHSFTWTSKSVSFRSTDVYGNMTSQTYAPSRPTLYIPQTAEPAHINLWIWGGDPVTTSQAEDMSLELIISNFTYTK